MGENHVSAVSDLTHFPVDLMASDLCDIQESRVFVMNKSPTTSIDLEYICEKNNRDLIV